jgi:hypothetical protein
MQNKNTTATQRIWRISDIKVGDRFVRKLDETDGVVRETDVELVVSEVDPFNGYVKLTAALNSGDVSIISCPGGKNSNRFIRKTTDDTIAVANSQNEKIQVFKIVD